MEAEATTVAGAVNHGSRRWQPFVGHWPMVA